MFNQFRVIRKADTLNFEQKNIMFFVFICLFFISNNKNKNVFSDFIGKSLKCWLKKEGFYQVPMLKNLQIWFFVEQKMMYQLAAKSHILKQNGLKKLAIFGSLKSSFFASKNSTILVYINCIWKILILPMNIGFSLF